MRVVVVILFAVLPLLVDSQSLPAGSKPTGYSLNITVPHLATTTRFNGTVEINVTVTIPTSQLLLHADNLIVSGVRVMRKSSFSGWTEEPISNFSIDNSLFSINFPVPVPTTSYKVTVVYQGHIQDSMAGFAKVRYSFNNTPTYLGVTRLEPTYARSVFPCYDEIGYRTSFVLDITVDKSYMVLTNVAPSYMNESDTMKTFHFDSYSPMPVSQLSWMMIDTTSYMRNYNNSTETVIISRAPYPYSNHTAWSAERTAHLLAALGKYTGQPYFYKVFEQVVIPEFTTRSFGAWGLSSYSEEALLVTPGITSTRDTQQVALGLSGGLAQQWFGGLVSMNSWEHQWLMRGFAGYLKYIIAASLPEMSNWELREQMVVEMVQPALALDTSQHALSFDTQGDPKKIETIYSDLIMYKGGAVMRMLDDVLGDLFNRALNKYFENSARSTSEPRDLWNIMYDAARESHVDLGAQSVEGIMGRWINTPGYPDLNVTWNTTHFNISQPLTSRWHVPVSFILQDSFHIVNKTWLAPGGSLTVPASSSKWILVNINQTGYYRVNYQEELLEALRIQLAAEPDKVPLLSKAQIIDDIFHHMYNGILRPEFPLKFTNCLKKVNDYYSWYSALKNYQDLLDRLYGYSAYQLLKEHILDLMEGVVAKVGYISQPQDSHVDKLMRVMVLEKACAFGHSVCVEKAVSTLRSWMEKNNPHYDKDITGGLFCAAANSSPEVWKSMWDNYELSLIPSVRANILRALACSGDVHLLNQFVTNITSTSAPVVNTKDKTILLKTLASTPFGAELLLDWLIQTLHRQMNSSGSTTMTVMNQTEDSSNTEKQTNLSSSDAPADQQMPPRVHRAAAKPGNLSEDDVKAILSYIVPKLTTLEQGAKIDGFVAKNNTGLSAHTLELMRKVTRQIYQQADWAHKHNGPITVWLQNKASSTTPEAPTEKPTPQPPTSVPPRPSSAPQTHSGLTLSVGLLVLVLLYIVTS